MQARGEKDEADQRWNPTYFPPGAGAGAGAARETETDEAAENLAAYAYAIPTSSNIPTQGALASSIRLCQVKKEAASFLDERGGKRTQSAMNAAVCGVGGDGVEKTPFSETRGDGKEIPDDDAMARWMNMHVIDDGEMSPKTPRSSSTGEEPEVPAFKRVKTWSAGGDGTTERQPSSTTASAAIAASAVVDHEGRTLLAAGGGGAGASAESSSSWIGSNQEYATSPEPTSDSESVCSSSSGGGDGVGGGGGGDGVGGGGGGSGGGGGDSGGGSGGVEDAGDAGDVGEGGGRVRSTFKLDPNLWIVVDRRAVCNAEMCAYRSEEDRRSRWRHYHSRCCHVHKVGPKKGMIFQHHQLEKVQKHQRAHQRAQRFGVGKARSPAAPRRPKNKLSSVTHVQKAQALAIKDAKLELHSPENWTPELTKRLRELVNECGPQWSIVADRIPGMTATACMLHWRASLNPNHIVKGSGTWTSEEDERLTKLVEVVGMKWSTIAKHIPGRIPKQCRERYLNYLDPSLRRNAPWTKAEEDLLMSLCSSNQNQQWAHVCRQIRGRSYNDVKNRFNLIQRRNKRGRVGEPPAPSCSIPSVRTTAAPCTPKTESEDDGSFVRGDGGCEGGGGRENGAAMTAGDANAAMDTTTPSVTTATANSTPGGSPAAPSRPVRRRRKSSGGGGGGLGARRVAQDRPPPPPPPQQQQQQQGSMGVPPVADIPGAVSPPALRGGSMQASTSLPTPPSPSMDGGSNAAAAALLPGAAVPADTASCRGFHEQGGLLGGASNVSCGGGDGGAATAASDATTGYGAQGLALNRSTSGAAISVISTASPSAGSGGGGGDHHGGGFSGYDRFPVGKTRGSGGGGGDFYAGNGPVRPVPPSVHAFIASTGANAGGNAPTALDGACTNNQVAVPVAVPSGPDDVGRFDDLYKLLFSGTEVIPGGQHSNATTSTYGMNKGVNQPSGECNAGSPEYQTWWSQDTPPRDATVMSMGSGMGMGMGMGVPGKHEFSTEFGHLATD